MLKLFVVGASGRMGRAIRQFIGENSSNEFVFIGGFDVKNQPELKIFDNISFFPEDTDVVIDFSSPQALKRYKEVVLKLKKPVVIGTTGFGENEFATLEEMSEKIPVFYSPNMSIGVNILFKLTEELMKMIDNSYDIEVVEMHHNKKKDAPSGTARKLVDIIASARNYSLVIHGREGNIGERKKEEIGVHAIRGGDVIGDHKVIVAGNSEMIELSHRAINRDVFVKGTLLAAKFIHKRSPGLYNMFDLLNLSE